MRRTWKAAGVSDTVRVAWAGTRDRAGDPDPGPGRRGRPGAVSTRTALRPVVLVTWARRVSAELVTCGALCSTTWASEMASAAERVQLDRELDAGVVVRRDLGPVDVVEREHRVRVVGVQPEGERVGAAAQEPGHVVDVLGVGALQRVWPATSWPLSHRSASPTTPLTTRLACAAGCAALNVVRNHHGHREARDRVGAERLHVAEAALQVGGEEDVGQRPFWTSASTSVPGAPPSSGATFSQPGRRIPDATRRRRRCRRTRCSGPASRAGRRSGWRRRRPAGRSSRPRAQRPRAISGSPTRTR